MNLFLFIYLYFFKDDNYGTEEVESLKSLVSNLHQLLDLHRKYNCKLSLSVCEKVCFYSSLMYSDYTWAKNMPQISPVGNEHFIFSDTINSHVTQLLTLQLTVWGWIFLGVWKVAKKKSSGWNYAET